MATSSITHNFVISDSKTAEQFAKVIEIAEKEKNERTESFSNCVTVTDSIEINNFTARWIDKCQKNILQ